MIMFQVGYMPLLLKLRLDRVFFRKLNEGMVRYKKYCAKVAELRTARQSEMKTKDVWTTLLVAKDPLTGQGLTSKELHSEAAVVISATSHPIRTTLCALIYYLINNPTCMETLRLEIHSTFSHIDDIRSGPNLQKCRFLLACVKETLRLSPGIPGIALRTVLKGGLTVDGAYFPEGTDVGVSSYVIHHDEEYFPKPFAFVPERWLARPAGDIQHDFANYATEESLRKANGAYFAFGVGPMACLGKNIAYHHIMLILARMVWQFEFRRAPTPQGYQNTRMSGAKAHALQGEFPLRDGFSSEGDGPWAQFRQTV
jgi:cytochrome P450